MKVAKTRMCTVKCEFNLKNMYFVLCFIHTRLRATNRFSSLNLIALRREKARIVHF